MERGPRQRRLSILDDRMKRALEKGGHFVKRGTLGGGSVGKD